MNKEENQDFIRSYIQSSRETLRSLSGESEQIARIVDLICSVVSKGGRIYSCGNGGSACDAMHLAEELVARYLRERPGIRAQHLIDSPSMTCWANDYDYDSVFRRQVETLMTKDDVLLVFSTSGNSENVLQAVEAANEIGGLSIALSGKDGGRVKSLAQHCFVVDSNTTSHIQEAHVALIHIICDLLEQRLYPECRD